MDEDVTMTSAVGNINNKAKLLDCAQRLIIAERRLTSCLKRNKPIISSLKSPSNMDQVDMILALARSYSNRTSAPTNWDPSIPVIHFSTPNPLPHQLRSGTLASMQLKLSRSIQKRTRLQQASTDHESAHEEKNTTIQNDTYDPKRERIHKDIPTTSQGPKNVQSSFPSSQPKNISMNLSDSSEEDYDEDDDESN